MEFLTAGELKPDLCYLIENDQILLKATFSSCVMNQKCILRDVRYFQKSHGRFYESKSGKGQVTGYLVSHEMINLLASRKHGTTVHYMGLFVKCWNDILSPLSGVGSDSPSSGTF